MGSVYRPTFTKPLPTGAELTTRKGQPVARWKDADGKARQERVTTPKSGKYAGQARLLVESSTFVAKYRDGAGVLQTVSTGCRDETAARSLLTDLERRAVRVKSKMLTPAEDAASDYQCRAMPEHVHAYLTHLEAKGTSPEHRRNVKGQLERVLEECRFNHLPDLSRSQVERWMVLRAAEGMGARTRNTHLAALHGFANWCVREGRLLLNPLQGVRKADERADPRRQRRALNENELAALLLVAQQRPLQEALLVRRGPNKGQMVAKVRDEVRAQLVELGRERALIYKTLVLTGLRKGELASLTIAAVDLSPGAAYLNLAPADEKARRGADLPLRPDLADDLRAWIFDRLRFVQAEAQSRGQPVPIKLPPDLRLFVVPRDLCRILDRDLVAAGIARIVTDNGKKN